MGEECKKEVKRNEIRSATDYRLMYRLSKACDGDINNMCATVCSPFSGQACGGTVLRCLVDNRANITSDDCKKETFAFEKSEANDIRVDKPLSDACKEDKEKFCADVKPGMGRVHQCLRDHKDELTEACKKEEEGLNVVQSDNVLLRPGVTNACSEEIVVHCKGVQPGRGRLFKCLQENMAKVEFSQKCTEQIPRRLSVPRSSGSSTPRSPRHARLTRRIRAPKRAKRATATPRCSSASRRIPPRSRRDAAVS